MHGLWAESVQCASMFDTVNSLHAGSSISIIAPRSLKNCGAVTSAAPSVPGGQLHPDRYNTFSGVSVLHYLLAALSESQHFRCLRVLSIRFCCSVSEATQLSKYGYL